MKFTIKQRQVRIGRPLVETEFEWDHEKLAARVTQVWKAVFGREPEIAPESNPIGDDDLPDVALRVGGFTIYPEHVKLTQEEMSQTLIETRDDGPEASNEVLRFVLTVDVVISGGQWEPDDYDAQELAWSPSFDALIDHMIKAQVGEALSSVWEGIILADCLADDKQYEGMI
jgi:hypothetical protein